MKIKENDIVGLVFEFVNKNFFHEKKHTIQLGNLCLYPAEIHLMLIILEGKNSNITRISEYLGITKGAISQSILRLEKKGIIKKERDPYNKNELSLYFTPLGKRALKKINKHKAAILDRINKHLSELADDEKGIVFSFMQNLLSSFYGD